MCSQVRIWLAPTHRQNNTPDVRPLLDGAHSWSMFMRHAALPCLIALLVGVIAWRPVALASAPLLSTVIGPAHKRFATVGGFQHPYANPEAVVGYRTHLFPEGAV